MYMVTEHGWSARNVIIAKINDVDVLSVNNN